MVSFSSAFFTCPNQTATLSTSLFQNLNNEKSKVNIQNLCLKFTKVLDGRFRIDQQSILAFTQQLTAMSQCKIMRSHRSNTEPKVAPWDKIDQILICEYVFDTEELFESTMLRFCTKFQLYGLRLRDSIPNYFSYGFTILLTEKKFISKKSVMEGFSFLVVFLKKST